MKKFGIISKTTLDQAGIRMIVVTQGKELVNEKF